MVALLKNSSYTEEVGQRLHAVAAEFGRLAGWLGLRDQSARAAEPYASSTAIREFDTKYRDLIRSTSV